MGIDPIQISAMLARGIDPTTGQPMQAPLQRPERVEQASSVRSGRKKKPLSEMSTKSRPLSPAPERIRFTIIEEPPAPPVRDDLDVLAIILPLEKYLSRRRAAPHGKLSGANRYRRIALIALEQQWMIEYWRARALHFERLQGIRDTLN